MVFLINLNLLYADTIFTGDTIKKPESGVVFGNIFAGFYYATNDNIVPQSAFTFTTGILGYSKPLNEKVKATLIYDVSRTTSFSYNDYSGISNYSEGSKYTAFLKMAQIEWRYNKLIEFNVGQLLNEQYLTVQDKFWDYRYIAFTQQEIHRFGMPADFGARFRFHLFNDKMIYSLAAFNGEGPFNYQDNYSKFLVSLNAEYRPSEKWIFKLYGDFQQPHKDTLTERFAFSAFAGYKSGKIKIGAEYNEVLNENYNSEFINMGTSIYIAYTLNDKIDILGRYDYIDKESSIYYGQYIIAGFQYQPVKNFYTSLNFRHNEYYNYWLAYFNFGIKF